MYGSGQWILCLAIAGTVQQPAISITIDAPPELSAVRARLESFAPERLRDIAPLVGAVDPGPPIPVTLAPDTSNVAHRLPTWIAGFTQDDAVVLFPSRSPRYPDDTLEDVLRHEIAHALIWRVSRGSPIPRWFNEGLAMAAERERGFEDQTQLLYQLLAGPRTNLEELDRLFAGGQTEETRAYALSGAIVHDVLQRFGPTAGAEIVQRVGIGTPFEAAFAEVTGMAPATVEFQFWQRERIWTNWLPIFASTTSLWLAITLLAFLAIYRRWRKNIEIEKQWEEEDDDESAQ